jgi:hypothetical protein
VLKQGVFLILIQTISAKKKIFQQLLSYNDCVSYEIQIEQRQAAMVNIAARFEFFF